MPESMADDSQHPTERTASDAPLIGQATGVPSAGTIDSGHDDPIGRPGLHHWRESTITRPGLDDRGNVFFAAIEMTRMPMILTDPTRTTIRLPSPTRPSST